MGRLLLMYAQTHGVVVMGPPHRIQRVGGNGRRSGTGRLRDPEGSAGVLGCHEIADGDSAR
jgi:hypothetical protein